LLIYVFLFPVELVGQTKWTPPDSMLGAIYDAILRELKSRHQNIDWDAVGDDIINTPEFASLMAEWETQKNMSKNCVLDEL
jgi:hypothetical protein